MLAKLKKLFSFEPTLTPEQQTHQLNLAAATLLIEVVNADDEISIEESELLPQLLQTSLNIDHNQALELIDEAKQTQRQSTSLFQFTEQVNANFNLQQKQQLLLAMWKLAYADGHLCQYEDQIIRRTADLLYLKHSELIQMRNQALS
ncbi:tellurite resistance TerB family protein [Shewanella marina]|uniref:tellurite resistance TerB family protein n=1 Tax=Shewanella marina TaxID=487319 RepID=UPI000471BFB1|nr:TerB family tellurite resistance protein [Shewanella marina]